MCSLSTATAASSSRRDSASSTSSNCRRLSLKSVVGRLLCRNSIHRKNAKQYSQGNENRLILISEDEDLNNGELRKVFRYIDDDGDGRISPKELQICVGLVGGSGEGMLSMEEAEVAVNSSDSDGDGLLGFEDFVKLMEETPDSEEERKKEMKEAFKMYEMKGTGCITPGSLRRMLNRLGQSTTMENCKAMIRRFDLNGDGVLSFDEFSAMMR